VSAVIDHRRAGRHPRLAQLPEGEDDAMSEPTPPPPILALVDDLFFLLKIEETAKHLGLRIAFAGGAAQFLAAFTAEHPALAIVDLTMAGVDFAGLFAQLRSDPSGAAVPVLGYTTHADWKRTGALHAHCTKVVTKDTLSRQLPELMQQLLRRG
jgi:CheY-like chemotaxis protein